jgi:hypothetical protein
LNGFLTRTETGIEAQLSDRWGYKYTLVGIPAERDGRKGYDVEIVISHVPEELWLPGVDE